MGKLTDKQVIAYLHRSFSAVDGLWFMKVEDKYGFDTALEFDHAVWQIFPKIQARELKKMLNLNTGIDDLKIALMEKMEIEGQDYTMEDEISGISFSVKMTVCPWHSIMQKSGREHLSVKVADTICRTEYSTWAKEFGGDIEFGFGETSRICEGGQACVLHFIKI